MTTETTDAPPTPDLRYPDRTEGPIRPSWSANPGYLNEEHRWIFERTKDIPGWQLEGDSYKLYEMGYFAGDVILEIGVYGGRSAVVELRGALSNPNRKKKPQFYGIDLDPAAMKRSYDSVAAAGLEEYALLYYGDIHSFMEEFSIRPTMVFVDGDHKYEGVRQDLEALSELLSPNVPVLCHDYLNKENETGDYGVRRAATEWEEAGCAEFRGVFGCSALFLTTPNCRGPHAAMSIEHFTQRREKLLGAYGVKADWDPAGALRRRVGELEGTVENLQKHLESSEADRAARLEVIHQMAAQIQTIEADRAARLEVINQMAAQIQAIEADRAARLEETYRLQRILAELSSTRGAFKQLLKGCARKVGLAGLFGKK